MERVSNAPTDETKVATEAAVVEAEPVALGPISIDLVIVDVERQATREKALVRKLDRSVLPILFLMYFMNHIDRNALPHARLNNLEAELGLKGSEYNLAISIFFIGYLLMQIPSNMLITRMRPSQYLSGCMLLWATLSACTAAVRELRGLLACRFLLGFVEAPFYPGALHLLACFYTKEELGTRIALMYMGQILSSGCAGLFAAGIFKATDGVLRLSGWRWLFIIEGSLTALVALLGFWLLPDSPGQTRWLTPEERALAVARVDRDRVPTTPQEQEQDGGAGRPRSVLDGLHAALTDPRTWLFSLMQNLHVSACTFNNFFPSIVRATRFAPDAVGSLLLTAPPYLASGALAVLLGWSSGRLRDRAWHITAGLGTAVAGFAMALCSDSVAVRYASTFVYASGAYAVGPVILGWVGSTLSQTPEKRAVAYAVVNVSASAAAVYGAFLWPSRDEPRYALGFSATAAFAAGSIVCTWAMRAWLVWLNKRLDEESGDSEEPQQRYVY